MTSDTLNRHLSELLVACLRSRLSVSISRSKKVPLMQLVSNFTDEAIVNDLICFEQQQQQQQQSDLSGGERALDAAAKQSADDAKHASDVKSLAHKCRVAIRRHVAKVHHYKSIKRALQTLPLPKCVSDYVTCSELISCFDVTTTLTMKSIEASSS